MANHSDPPEDSDSGAASEGRRTRDAIDPHTVPVRTRLAFGLGTTSETLSLYSLGVLGWFYYNQVLGLDVLLAGLVPTLAIFADAISDPFMGSLSDRWRSKRWGRRHPFMFAAPVPVALSFWCVFNPPAGLEGGSLFAWFLVWSILLRTFMTVFHVPHLAMGGELSKEYTERTKIMSYNNFFGWIGGAVFFKINTVLFFVATVQYANGLRNPESYRPFSICMALVIVTVLFASAWFTRDRIPTLPQPAADAGGFSAGEFYRDVFKAFSNRNYVFLMLALFALSLMLGLRGGMYTYMVTYYWEFTATEFGNLVLIGSLLGYLAGFLFTAHIHGRFDKRATIVTTALLLSIFPAMPVTLRLLGFFPENDSPWLFWCLAGFGALGALSGSILNISVMSALADIADENALRYGVRQEGMLYSARTFFAKLDTSLGTGIAAVVLKLLEFPKNAEPGQVDAEIIHWMGIVESPLAIFPGIIAAVLYAQYRIDKSGYEETRRKLAALDDSNQAGGGADDIREEDADHGIDRTGRP